MVDIRASTWGFLTLVRCTVTFGEKRGVWLVLSQLQHSVVYGPWSMGMSGPGRSAVEYTAILWCGYGSIPINTIFSGMNIHLPAILMFTRGTRFWHTAMCQNAWYFSISQFVAICGRSFFYGDSPMDASYGIGNLRNGIWWNPKIWHGQILDILQSLGWASLLLSM